VEVFQAPATGIVTRVEPRAIGRGVAALGGARQNVDDTLDPTVGFVITVKPGDRVLAGEPIASVFAQDKAGVERGLAALRAAILVGPKLTEKPLPLISHRVTRSGVEELAKGEAPAKAPAKAPARARRGRG
jgi:thymidine phosphorylase